MARFLFNCPVRLNKATQVFRKTDLLYKEDCKFLKLSLWYSLQTTGRKDDRSPMKLKSYGVVVTPNTSWKHQVSSEVSLGRLPFARLGAITVPGVTEPLFHRNHGLSLFALNHNFSNF